MTSAGMHLGLEYAKDICKWLHHFGHKIYLQYVFSQRVHEVVELNGTTITTLAKCPDNLWISVYTVYESAMGDHGKEHILQI